MGPFNNQDGSYAIQEQGDLGLGLTEIDSKYIQENGSIQIPKDDGDDFAKRNKKRK